MQVLVKKYNQLNLKNQVIMYLQLVWAKLKARDQ